MITMDYDAHKVTVGERDVELTRKEFQVLTCFVERPGRIVTRDLLAYRVWNTLDPGKTLDMHLSTLRRKLGEDVTIKTLRGIGYRLDKAPGFQRIPGLSRARARSSRPRRAPRRRPRYTESPSRDGGRERGSGSP